MYDRAQDLAVALDLNCQGSLDSCRRIHRPAQLVGDAPEGVAQLFLVGVGHSDEKQIGLIVKLWCNADDSAHGCVVREIFRL